MSVMAAGILNTEFKLFEILYCTVGHSIENVVLILIQLHFYLFELVCSVIFLSIHIPFIEGFN